ncbi:hypothetical protein LCGC14_1404140, partial [marine sediment metagenome]
MNKYEVVIIGAGAAGLMCALTAGQRGRKVLLLDHADRVGKKILISGGTGSLGNALVGKICTDYEPEKLIIFSRDEYKQKVMAEKFDYYPCLRFFLGDVRDSTRLKEVCRDVDIVIHAAALKQIPTLEYNPTEAIKTNVDGTVNIVEACIYCGVSKAVLISTDKAVNPVNLYGATKLCAEKVFLAANSFNKTKFSVVRYGNVLNSRGSVIEHFLKLKKAGIKEFPITDERMTRFWLTLEEASELVINSLSNGECL